MKRENIGIFLKTELPGPNARRLEEEYGKYFAHGTYAYGAIRKMDGLSIGPWMHDVDGNWLLDFTAQVGVTVLGYNNPEVISRMDMLRRDYGMQSVPVPEGHAGTDFIVGDPSPAIELAKEIVGLGKDFGFEQLFMATSGTKAVSAAKKACQDNRRGAKYGISFKAGFHGRTLDSLTSTTSRSVQRKFFDSPGHELLLNYCVEDPCVCGARIWDRHTGQMMSEIEQLLNPSYGFIDPEEVKYIIIEPIQGEGGYWVPSESFIKEVARCAEEYGIPLISDEIQAGTGRTGKWWAIENFGIKPDLITFGKGFQVNGVVGPADNLFVEEGRESETCGNGGIGANKLLESLASIQYIKEADLLYNAKNKGKMLHERLAMMHMHFPKLLTSYRGIGLMQALEFESPEKRDEFEVRCFQKGLMTLGCGYRSLRFLPPLDVSGREIETAYGIMWRVAEEMAKK